MTDPSTTPATTVELVRHAEAYRRNQWRDRPDVQRPLNARGTGQALALADQLASSRVAVIFSSPLARCMQTVEPLAVRSGLAPIESRALAEVRTVPVLDGGDAWVSSAWLGGRAVGFLERVVTDHPGAHLVACTHGDVLSATLATLAGRDGLDLDDVSCPKGGRYTLTFHEGRCTGAALVAAPEP